MAYVLYCPKCKWLGEIDTLYPHLRNKCPTCRDKLWTSRGNKKEVEGWLRILQKRKEREKGK
jgi:hypothetical protein